MVFPWIMCQFILSHLTSRIKHPVCKKRPTMNAIPADSIAAFLLGVLVGVAICGVYCFRRHDRPSSDGEPGYTRRIP